MVVGMASLLVWRIWAVNAGAHLPELRQIPQGETAVYRGVEYQIEESVLWDYWDFFEKNSELQKYQDYQSRADAEQELRMLVVRCRAVRREENGVLKGDFPLQYARQYNMYDPFLMMDMNPSLAEGTFTSGDTFVIPYVIYQSNLTDDQWKQVEEKTMTYALVMGTYPIKNELLITEVKESKK